MLIARIEIEGEKITNLRQISVLPRNFQLSGRSASNTLFLTFICFFLFHLSSLFSLLLTQRKRKLSLPLPLPLPLSTSAVDGPIYYPCLFHCVLVYSRFHYYCKSHPTCYVLNLILGARRLVKTHQFSPRLNCTSRTPFIDRTLELENNTEWLLQSSYRLDQRAADAWKHPFVELDANLRDVSIKKLSAITPCWVEI